MNDEGQRFKCPRCAPSLNEAALVNSATSQEHEVASHIQPLLFAVNRRSEKLRQAVTHRQQQLLQQLASLSTTEAKSNDGRDPSLVLSALDLDESQVCEAISRWGSPEDRQVEVPAGLKFNAAQRTIQWKPVLGALKYKIEVQGPLDEEDYDVVTQTHEVVGTRWPFLFPSKCVGRYQARVSALVEKIDDDGEDVPSHDIPSFWSPYSPFIDFRLANSELFRWNKQQHRDQLYASLPMFPVGVVDIVGSYVPGLVKWSLNTITQLALGRDPAGSRCVVRRNKSWRPSSWMSIMSHEPLSAMLPSVVQTVDDGDDEKDEWEEDEEEPEEFQADRLTGVAYFSVRIDRCQANCKFPAIAVGVCHSNMCYDTCAGYSNEYGGIAMFGYSYLNPGGFYACGNDTRTWDQSRYGDGDVIGVALDYDNKTLKFFKNSQQQGETFYDVDTSEPIYACVSLTTADDQVALV